MEETLEQAAERIAYDSSEENKGFPSMKMFVEGAKWMENHLNPPSGKIVINSDNYTVSFEGKKIVLPKKEFELLRYLQKHSGRVITRDELLNAVWLTEFIGDRTIDVHIRKLRAKISIAPIKTIKKIGYIWDKYES